MQELTDEFVHTVLTVVLAGDENGLRNVGEPLVVRATRLLGVRVNVLVRERAVARLGPPLHWVEPLGLRARICTARFREQALHLVMG